ncbi:hypothetical protein QBC36DRAFT_370395 [Triangularia setosa]|uniref:Uncharacterized protein n=1 Tax=Triangularia setosa TaxID=2587417 RepID=A0AAN7A9B6_9PEZI|nr:hypothetical protein QBC36DRAFT_370395 [Podospora setosa]
MCERAITSAQKHVLPSAHQRIRQMEPLTALGVAGNVLQCVEFVGKLFGNTYKIFTSLEGYSADNAHLKDICEKLLDLSKRLPNSVNFSGPQNYISIFQEAELCQKNCKQILDITTKLRTRVKDRKTSRYWSSFKSALAEVWMTDEIEALRRRITDRGSGMTLLISVATRLVAASMKATSYHCCGRF